MKEEEKIKKLQKQLKECQTKKEECLEGWKRAQANFLNYKKQESERISGLMEFANENLVLKMLPILDNIDIALKELPQDLKNHQWLKGFLNIRIQILNFLEKEGVGEMKSAAGEKFDPNFHEVVEAIENKDCESGIVVEEVKKGYTLNGKVIRAAKVRVSK